jgi:hypothetical protein
VIQEALTNVIRHAPQARAHLLVRYGERELVIVVVDDGPGAAAGGDGGPSAAAAFPRAVADVPEGHGLLGMRERVSLAGGRLLSGPALGGGFRVEARLPLGAPEDGPGGPRSGGEATAQPGPDATAQPKPEAEAGPGPGPGPDAGPGQSGVGAAVSREPA